MVVEAPPGSGKTTRIPAAIAERFDVVTWVLEPRRIAARAAARWVASERGQRVGEDVGFAMRFERASSPATRVLYVTEALLVRRLDDLDGIGAVVIDEFHERSIHADVALAWCKELRTRRPELKLVVMSATLDGASVATYLGCGVVRAEGQLHPVTLEHADPRDGRSLEDRVRAAVNAAAGDTLVFLPGRGEIARCQDHLRDIAADILPLHGDVESADQDRALRRGSRRRVVLATNVAETSITAEGITTVVDSGLHRVAGHDPWTGFPTLELAPIPRTSAAQRAGRAGRLGPGRCVRLYTQPDHDARPAALAPELLRADLAPVVLALGGRALDWLDPPPAGTWAAAVSLLRRLGALAGDGAALHVTDVGLAMRALPLHPRLSRVLVEAMGLGVGEIACALVTLPGRAEGDLVALALDGRGDARESRQLRALLPRELPRAPADPAARARLLARALLAGFPDRVGRREAARVRMAESGAATCPHGLDAFVVVPDVERVGTRTRARAMTEIPVDWLLDGAAVVTETRWTGERVDVREELRYGALVLEGESVPGDPAAVAELLAEHVVGSRDLEEWERGLEWIARVGYLRRSGIDLPAIDEAALVRQACAGSRSLAELKRVSALDAGRALLGADAARVDRLAPEHVALPGRARAPVRYTGDSPRVSSRMQDFFGLREGPSIHGGPLVVELLAPSGRPVQVTRDLAGFWTRHWPQLRKELMRRYPRHRWPEDPQARVHST